MKRDDSQPRLIRGTVLAGGLALFLIMGGFALLAVGYEHLYSGRMYPGVTILGVTVGGQTYAEARVLAAQRATQLLDQEISLQFPDNKNEMVTPRLLGLGLDPDRLVQTAYLEGRNGSFLERTRAFVTLKTSGAAFAFTPSFDASSLLEKLEPILARHDVAVTDATLSVTDGVLTATKDAAGQQVNRARLQIELTEYLTHLNVPTTVVVSTEILLPHVTTNMLAPIMAEAERITAAPLILEAAGQTVTATTKILLTWLTITDQQAPIELTWNTGLISDFLAEKVAPRVDLPMQPRKVEKDSGKILSKGEVGRSLDQEAALRVILAQLRGRQEPQAPIPVEVVTIILTVTEEPIEERTVVPPFTPGLYAGKYLEINLSEQQLYQWEGTNLLISYTVSTGKWDTPTPQGVLYIKNHIPYAYSQKYDLYMPFWMGLARDPDGGGYEGYGIHELPEWRNGVKEGESHLGTPVSHGCIRLGVGPAEAVYNWAEEGMPVYIHT